MRAIVTAVAENREQRDRRGAVMNVDRARHFGIGRPFRLCAAGRKRQKQGQTQKDTVHDVTGQAFTSAMKIRMPIERPIPHITKRMKPAKVFSCSLTGMLPCL